VDKRNIQEPRYTKLFMNANKLFGVGTRSNGNKMKQREEIFEKNDKQELHAGGASDVYGLC